MYHLLDLPFLANKHFPHNCNTRRVLEMEHALRHEASSLFLLKLLKPPPSAEAVHRSSTSSVVSSASSASSASNASN